MLDVEDSVIMLHEQMEEVGAHTLLRKELKDSPDVDIAELATTLDYIPQALVQAAAYIRRSGDESSFAAVPCAVPAVKIGDEST
jgi:hypothetical protein